MKNETKIYWLCAQLQCLLCFTLHSCFCCYLLQNVVLENFTTSLQTFIYTCPYYQRLEDIYIVNLDNFCGLLLCDAGKSLWKQGNFLLEIYLYHINSFITASGNSEFTFLTSLWLYFQWCKNSLIRADNDDSIRRPPAIVMWLGHMTCTCVMFACVEQCRIAASMR
jgi:hypothetical protein